ncbi:MAG TPA: Gfo/Idh/MocA family oxidoreductase [Parapedobacter sp.]|uniref:Gfo/Idh/MocA family protein n=1 Tax=Parapedobacter sp. TaxID=1958893 RepID=UPI002C4D9C63|nr:Gfo/Idh/MocA family oxidoreductase [Parapedobacter sp.]HWK59672.1 Gfo/Idh/MocA family oxidoreductase [Parapedobacter sp.]
MKRRTFVKNSIYGVGFLNLPVAFGGQDSSAFQQQKIKIGQIGVCHEHASARMDTLKKMSDVFEIVGVVDDRNSTAARFSGNNLKSFEGLKWMSEEELLNYPGMQAVMVETANSDLVTTSIRCMNRGLAIAMDKPGGEDLALFQQLINGCKTRNLPFQMGYMFRGNPAIQFCQRAVREGWLGDVFEMRGTMSHNYGGEGYQRYLSNFHGGIMFNLGCHIIDLIVSMLGRPEKVTSFLGATKSAADSAYNNCLAVMEYAHAKAWVHACDSEFRGQRYLKISGTKGTIELSPLERFDGKSLELDLRLRDGNAQYTSGNHVVTFDAQDDRYIGQLAEFAKVIKGEIANPYTFEHDLLVHQVHLAASGNLPWS